MDAALNSRALLQRESQRARLQGRAGLVGAADAAACGMENQGATCYLTSLLQSLFVLEDVRKAVFAFRYQPALHGSPDLRAAPAAEAVAQLQVLAAADGGDAAADGVIRLDASQRVPDARRAGVLPRPLRLPPPTA